MNFVHITGIKHHEDVVSDRPQRWSSITDFWLLIINQLLRLSFKIRAWAEASPAWWTWRCGGTRHGLPASLAPSGRTGCRPWRRPAPGSAQSEDTEWRSLWRVSRGWTEAQSGWKGKVTWNRFSVSSNKVNKTQAMPQDSMFLAPNLDFVLFTYFCSLFLYLTLTVDDYASLFFLFFCYCHYSVFYLIKTLLYYFDISLFWPLMSK